MITLQLADVPFDADVANPQGRPMGTRDQVAARFGDLLPGTQFDAEGRGVFRRGSYDIAFKMYGDPPTSIGVAFNAPEAFAALARIVDKTNWCLIDPDQKGFVDLPASRAAGRTVLLGDDTAVDAVSGDTNASAAPQASAAASTPAADWKPVIPRLGLPRRTRLLLATLTGLVVASSGLWLANKWTDGALMKRLPASVLASQRQEISGRVERYEDRIRRRGSAEQGLAPMFQGNKIVLEMLDMQLASRTYWNFVDGKFSSPELLSNEAIWARYKMPTFLPATFAQKQRYGYEFEFRGAGCESTEPNWPECTAYAYFARPMNREGSDPTFALFSSDDKIHYTNDGSNPSRDSPTVTSRQPVSHTSQ